MFPLLISFEVTSSRALCGAISNVDVVDVTFLHISFGVHRRDVVVNQHTLQPRHLRSVMDSPTDSQHIVVYTYIICTVCMHSL